MSLPRIIQVTQCTAPSVNRWYEDLVGYSFAVMEATGDHYVVDEYEITIKRCIPLTIKKEDCIVVHH